MSKKIVGKLNMPNPCPVYGTFPTHSHTISVHVNALPGQRDTLAAKINKYLSQSNGFNRAQFTPVNIAVFPLGYKPHKHSLVHFFVWSVDGVQRLCALLDGDHRKHMHTLCIPGNDEMPCSYTEVSNEEEYHWLYVLLNGKGRTNQTNDEVFIQEVLAAIPAALATEKLLKACGLSVRGGSETGGTVGDLNGPVVKIGAFLTAIKLSSAKAVKLATDALVTAYNLSAGDKLLNNLLIGFAIAFSLYEKELTSRKMSPELCQWMKAMAMQPQRRLSRSFQVTGGDVHNRQGQSVARGIITEFREASAGVVTIAYKRKRITLVPVNRLFN